MMMHSDPTRNMQDREPEADELDMGTYDTTYNRVLAFLDGADTTFDDFVVA